MRANILLALVFMIAISLLAGALYGCSDDTEPDKDAGADAALVETGPAEASADKAVTQPEASTEASAGDANAGDTAPGE
jgi:hypothetical protein